MNIQLVLKMVMSEKWNMWLTHKTDCETEMAEMNDL